MQDFDPHVQSRQIMRTLETRGVKVALEDGNLVGRMDSGPIPDDMVLFIRHFEQIIEFEIQRHENARATGPLLSSAGALASQLPISESPHVEQSEPDAFSEASPPRLLDSIQRVKALDAEQALLAQRLANDAKSDNAGQAQTASSLERTPELHPDGYWYWPKPSFQKSHADHVQTHSAFSETRRGRNSGAVVDWIIRCTLGLVVLVVFMWAWPKLMEPACKGCQPDESQADAYARQTYDAWELGQHQYDFADVEDVPAQQDAPPAGLIDCDSFSSQQEAQRFFEDNGGPMFDSYWLDGDNDGIACEWN